MKMKVALTALTGGLFSIALAFSACQREEAAATRQAGKYEINFTPAKTNGELEALRNKPDANLIRSLAQFDALVASRLTPLSKLPDDVVADFREEIVFRNGIGVVGLEYKIIKNKLNPVEFHEVMALFGLDTRNGFWGGASSNPGGRSNASEDKNDSCCDKTCISSPGTICLSGCGS